MPVVKKDGLLEIAQKLELELREDFATMLEPTGNIGKNYRRQDEIGTPYCVTIDHQTKDDQHGDYPLPRQHEAGARGHGRPSELHPRQHEELTSAGSKKGLTPEKKLLSDLESE